MRHTRLDAPQVTREGLLAPRDLGRITNGRKGRDADVRGGVLQEDGEGAVAAHGVPKDGLLHAHLALEHVLHQRRQLRGDIGVHLVVRSPRFRGGVHVKAGAGSEVVRVVGASDGNS